jgi:hypothetical protein
MHLSARWLLTVRLHGCFHIAAQALQQVSKTAEHIDNVVEFASCPAEWWWLVCNPSGIGINANGCHSIGQ